MNAAQPSAAAEAPPAAPAAGAHAAVAPLARLLAALAAVPPIALAVGYVITGAAWWPVAAVVLLLCAWPPAAMALRRPADAFGWRGDAALLALAMLVAGTLFALVGGIALWLSGVLLIFACAVPAKGRFLLGHVLVAAAVALLITSPLVLG